MYKGDFTVSKPLQLGEVQGVVINPYYKDLKENIFDAVTL